MHKGNSPSQAVQENEVDGFEIIEEDEADVEQGPAEPAPSYYGAPGTELGTPGISGAPNIPAHPVTFFGNGSNAGASTSSFTPSFSGSYLGGSYNLPIPSLATTPAAGASSNTPKLKKVQ